MGSKKPHACQIVEQWVPLRLTVVASGTVQDWQNEQIDPWLRRKLGDHGDQVMPAMSFSGKRAVRTLASSVSDTAALLLARPHLRLHKPMYEGSKR